MENIKRAGNQEENVETGLEGDEKEEIKLCDKKEKHSQLHYKLLRADMEKHGVVCLFTQQTSNEHLL